MKHLFLSFFVLLALVIKAQSFQKKTNVISFGADVGLYNYVSEIKSYPTSSQLSATNQMVNLQFERGIKNWLGLGAQIKLSQYATAKNTLTSSNPSVQALDAIILLNAHIIRVKRLDLLAGINVGYSSLTALNLETANQLVSKTEGGGLTYDAHIQPRFYILKHLGIFVNLAYVNYNYKNLDFTNNTSKISDVLNLKGGGTNIGFGLQVMF